MGAVTTMIVAGVAKAAAAVSAVGAAVGGATATVLGGGALATAVGTGVSLGVQGAVYGSVIGGTASKLQGGSFSEGFKSGAKLGAASGFVGGMFGSLGGSIGNAVGGESLGTAFKVGKTVGGFVGGAVGAKAVGASNQTALMAGATMGFQQYGSATQMQEDPTFTELKASNAFENFKAAAKAAPVTGQILGSAILSGAVAPQVQTGFQMQAGKEKNDTSASESKTTPGFKDIASGGKPITDANFGGTGIVKSFDPSLGASYQSQPAASVASVSAARKSFLTSRNMKRLGGGIDYGSEFSFA